MPQFDISNFTSQIFWTVICFSFLYIMSKKLFLPKISKIIDDRSVKIQSINQNIKNISQKLSDLNQNIDDIKDKSITEYSNMISDSHKICNENRSKALGEVKTEVTNMRISYEFVMNNIANDYSDQSKKAIDNLAKKITNKIIK